MDTEEKKDFKESKRKKWMPHEKNVRSIRKWWKVRVNNVEWGDKRTGFFRVGKRKRRESGKGIKGNEEVKGGNRTEKLNIWKKGWKEYDDYKRNGRRKESAKGISTRR